jgi:hypothetical protein
MISIQAHFDGKVLVPDDPLDLPLDQALILRTEPANGIGSKESESSLIWMAENAVDDSDLPADISHQHDHYLYGTPKRPA